jgi:hypothetical protein
MGTTIDLQRLLVLRRLTRSLEDHLRSQVREQLSTLTPLLRPQTVLGADRVWKEVQALHDGLAPKGPFHLARDLRPPLDVPGTAIEMAPVEYVHAAMRSGQPKPITVTKPFEWVLSYSAHGPARLRELIADKNRDAAELQRNLVLAIVLHLVIKNQPGVGRLFTSLRTPVVSRQVAEFGELPLTVLGTEITTVRPADDVLVESTEMTGTSTFQEVVDLDHLKSLADPFRTRLLALLREQGEDLG